MSIVAICGFGTGTVNELENVTGTFAITSTYKRTQSFGGEFHPLTTAVGHGYLRGWSSAGAKTNLGAANAYFRGYLYVLTAPVANNEEILTFNTGITDKAFVRLNSDRTISVYDSLQTLIGTSTTAVPLETWTRIEVYCATGVGAVVQLRINGVLEVNGTGSVGSNTAGVKLGKVTNRNGQTIHAVWDDCVVDAATWPGEGRVFYLQPNAAGTYDQFTGAYTAADEVPWDDADYLVSSGTVGHAETWGNQNFSGVSSGKIAAVQSLMRVVRDGGVSGALQLRRRVGGVNYDTTGSLSVGSTAVLLGQIDATNPGGGAWTPSAVDAMEVGAVEASANLSRIMGAIVAVATREPSPGTPSGANQSSRGLNIGIGIGL